MLFWCQKRPPQEDFMQKATEGSNCIVAGIIPARWGSTRFPGKPLHRIAGKPLVQHVWERCSGCRKLDRLLVATDDERIAEGVREFGGEVVMTSTNHPTGTDRLAEVMRRYPEFTHAINIQGDEPLIDPGLIDELCTVLRNDSGCEMVTAANPLAPGAVEASDPNVVKVVLDLAGRALYFSRSLIPFPRAEVSGLEYYRHKGIYGYSKEFLFRFVEWPPSLLERAESLEQLRALENGVRIQVVVTEDDSPGIDTPEQARILHQRLLS